MTDSFDDDVEAWIDRLETDFTEADEATSEGLRPANLQETQEITRARQPTERPPAADLEARLADQVAMLSSARRELARTEQLVEMMKAISAEIRALREDLGRVKGKSSEVSALRRDVDEIKELLTRMRELAAARCKAISPGRTDPE